MDLLRHYCRMVYLPIVWVRAVRSNSAFQKLVRLVHGSGGGGRFISLAGNWSALKAYQRLEGLVKK